MIDVNASDPIDVWVAKQLAEPWPLADHQLDVIRRALAPASTTGQRPAVQLPNAA